MAVVAGPLALPLGTEPCGLAERHGPVPAASPPCCAILECSRVCSVDYTVVLGLRELLDDFRRQGVTLVFAGLQVGVPKQLAPVSQTSP